MERDINLKILVKYGGYDADLDVLKKGGRIFPNRTATFREFVQFLVHGKEDFKDDPEIIYKGKLEYIGLDCGSGALLNFRPSVSVLKSKKSTKR